MNRLLIPTDLLTLRHKPRSLALLNDDALLLQRHRTVLFGIRSLFANNSRYTTYVNHEGSVSGILQASSRESRPEQQVVALATYGSDYQLPTDHDIWFRLLETHVVQSAQQQIQRLYVTQPGTNSDMSEIFRQSGYTSYARQMLLRLDGPDWDQGTRLAIMQPQSRHDVWGVHQLYGRITPRPVQHAEAKAARDWMLPLQTPWDGVKRRAWVLRHNEQIIATVRIRSGREAHLMHLHIDVNARELATDMLRFGISQIADTLPIWLVLRDYQEDLLWSAQDLGFQPIDEQSLWVRHNVSFMRRSAFARVLEPTRESGSPIPTIVPASEQARLYARTKRNNQ